MIYPDGSTDVLRLERGARASRRTLNSILLVLSTGVARQLPRHHKPAQESLPNFYRVEEKEKKKPKRRSANMSAKNLNFRNARSRVHTKTLRVADTCDQSKQNNQQTDQKMSSSQMKTAAMKYCRDDETKANCLIEKLEAAGVDVEDLRTAKKTGTFETLSGMAGMSMLILQKVAECLPDQRQMTTTTTMACSSRNVAAKARPRRKTNASICMPTLRSCLRICGVFASSSTTSFVVSRT